MYVCICNAVTDTEIEHAVENGAVTLSALTAELNVGNQCGKCCSCAKKIINNKLLQIAEAEPAVA